MCVDLSKKSKKKPEMRPQINLVGAHALDVLVIAQTLPGVKGEGNADDDKGLILRVLPSFMDALPLLQRLKGQG